MMVRCVRVPKAEGNPVRMSLKAEGLLDIDHRITADGDSLLIPILCDSFGGYPIEDCELEEIEHQETDYRMFLPEEIREILPNSFDCIGDLIIIKIEDELLPYKTQIGDALLKVNKNVRLVLMDGGVKGELRIRELEPIAGTGPTETRHKESGVTMITDPAKVYFNPRLATERMHVASQVKDGEIIIDMFAGVAPFPLVICKHAHPEKVYSIDLNHDAYLFMKRNIALNRASNIIPMEGDASEVVKDLPQADRVIMNLPQIAYRFLDVALSKTKKGGIVHMHRIMERSESDTLTEQLINDMCQHGLSCHLSEKRELKTYSPTASVYVFDIVKD